MFNLILHSIMKMNVNMSNVLKTDIQFSDSGVHSGKASSCANQDNAILALFCVSLVFYIFLYYITFILVFILITWLKYQFLHLFRF